MNQFCIFELNYDLFDPLAKLSFQVVPRIGEFIFIDNYFYEVIQIVYDVRNRDKKQCAADIFVKRVMENDERLEYLSGYTFEYKYGSSMRLEK